MNWFSCRRVAPGLFLLAEPGHVNSWLIEGGDRAVLVDTGMGIVPIRPVAERLTTLPLSVVNTHSHWDHVGGNHEFEQIAIHKKGAAMLGEPVPREILNRYLRFTRRLIDALPSYSRLDREFFHLLSADSEPRPLPESFDGSRWTIRPSSAGQLLGDGDRIDLGAGRVLTVLHTPGHSPDSISLLDEREGILFGGDTINTGPIYAHLAASNLDDFVESAARLAALESDLRLVTVHHFGRVVAEPSLLAEIAEGFRRTQTGEIELTPAVDCLDEPVAESRFARFSIFLPRERLEA